MGPIKSMKMRAEIAGECSIFYVDDDPDDLWLFRQAAESVGQNVCVFDYADLMIHALLNPPPQPSLIFVDLNMPAKDGFEVINDIQKMENLRELPIVVYSTSDNINTIRKCKQIGVNLYVPKPVKVADIKKVIQQVTEIDWSNHQVTNENFVLRT